MNEADYIDSDVNTAPVATTATQCDCETKPHSCAGPFCMCGCHR